uniref:protein-tyrosine-phosphatase n=1 Tax=Salarias fasciatus TaxID=181472 RepID=A0A672HVU4_SALFA
MPLQTISPLMSRAECLCNVVRSRTSSIKNELGLTCEVGALKENIKKNRYKDILPYDQTRVVLPDSDSDYINASFIQGATEGCRYIACQGPLSSTLTHFWTMIWQYNVKVFHLFCVLCVSEQRKCECYWAAEHQEASFGPFTVTTNSAQEWRMANSITSCLISDYPPLQEVRHVTQHHFLSWPDHDVPQEPFAVLDLLQGVRSSRGGDTSPLLVHCSAGCGRTGVICALDYIHDLLVTKQVTEDLSILKVVLELRQQRPSAVQTKCCVLFFVSFDSGSLLASVSRPITHLYDNESGASATPIYSVVRPRSKAPSRPHSAMTFYDFPTPANQRPAETQEYQLVSGGVVWRRRWCRGGAGRRSFNNRVERPKGPREPPAEWSRLER